MHIPMRWGRNANRHGIHIRHETPKPHPMPESRPSDLWWRGGHALKRSQRQRRRDARRGY